MGKKNIDFQTQKIKSYCFTKIQLENRHLAIKNLIYG